MHTTLQASFVADGSSDISVDDPDFWQKWAEKAKLDLDELANKVHVLLADISAAVDLMVIIILLCVLVYLGV